MSGQGWSKRESSTRGKTSIKAVGAAHRCTITPPLVLKLANLTKSFLQSVHSSPYMHSIFKAYVMEEAEYKSQVRKPFFSPDSTYVLIKEAFFDLRGQIFSLTSKQWQIRITQKWSTHIRDPTSGTFCYQPPQKNNTLLLTGVKPGRI